MDLIFTCNIIILKPEPKSIVARNINKNEKKFHPAVDTFCTANTVKRIPRMI
jgi:hypothetical protein